MSTTTSSSSGGGSGGSGQRGTEGVSYYFELEKQLNSYFNSKELTTSERADIAFKELAPLLLASFGYLVASLGLNLFVGVAWAQPVKVFGLNHHEWSMAIYLAYNAVILGVLVMLIITIVRGSKSQWSWRTASFLLGFLVKSISVIPTF